MEAITYYVCIPFGYLMKWCWQLVGNYGLAILLFTLATKLVLMPISVWIQKNSILMVKIQPEVNFLKARLNGNLDAIADEQAKLFKREHYHPMLSIIPLILQIFLLLAVVEIIYNPITYLFGVENGIIEAIANHFNLDLAVSGTQIEIINLIKNGSLTALTPIEGVSSEALQSLVEKSNALNLNFLGTNLSVVPNAVWGWYILMPIVAGLSSFLMCWTQNLSNVIQHEQGKVNQYGIMIVSVGISLYLGLFVPSGIALYWILSNLVSIGQMYLLNVLINPKKYVDYEALEASRKALAEAKEFGKIDKKDPLYKEMKKREKQDYKAFKHIANKHVVIYSEKSGFYKYYKDIIAEMLKRSNVVIHYVTNDYNDIIFEIAKDEPRIKPYYISLKKTTILMMLVETDVFIMTTPDLDKYYLKRSFIKKDIEYIYVPHDSMSVHMGFSEGALNAFDTIMCSGPHVVKEIRKTEEVYGLKEKTLVEFGFPLMDELIKKGKEESLNKEKSKVKDILIAPSWQEDNILDSCIDEIIEKLYGNDYRLIVRPHPEYVKRCSYQLNNLVEKYKDYDKEKLVFELDFSTNKSVYSADLLITDWSGISTEYCFATENPAIFINTKMKVNNPNWENLGITPMEIVVRDIIGVSINKDEVCKIDEVALDLFKNRSKYSKKIKACYETFTFNHGTAGEVGAKYVLNSIVQKRKNNKS